MRVQVENILRNAADIRRAVLSMQADDVTAEQQANLVEIDELAAQIEFKTRGLDFADGKN